MSSSSSGVGAGARAPMSSSAVLRRGGVRPPRLVPVVAGPPQVAPPGARAAQTLAAPVLELDAPSTSSGSGGSTRTAEVDELAREFAAYRLHTEVLEHAQTLQQEIASNLSTTDMLLATETSELGFDTGWLELQQDDAPVPHALAPAPALRALGPPLPSKQQQGRRGAGTAHGSSLLALPEGPRLPPSTARQARRVSAHATIPASTMLEPATTGARSSSSSTRNADDQHRSATGDLLQRMAGTKLLTVAQQKEVAALVKDYLGLKDSEKELRSVLRRPPTLAEWARALRMDPRAFQARLQRGQEAKALMLKANYRLVVKVAKGYTNRGLGMQDLVSEGMRGLVKGVEKFEADKGFRFSTYAHWWIRQAISRAIQEQSRAVRLPAHLHEQYGKLAQARAELTQRLARAPTQAELAQALHVTPAKVAQLLEVARPSASLDVAASSGAGKGDHTLSEAKDLIQDERALPDEVAESAQLASSLEATLEACLTAREAAVLRLHWGLDGRPAGMTLEDIGGVLGVSKERVRQVEVRALRKLRSEGALAGALAELRQGGAHLVGADGGRRAQAAARSAGHARRQ